MGLPPELEKIDTHEDQEMGPHQEETKLVDLGTGSGKKIEVECWIIRGYY